MYVPIIPQHTVVWQDDHLMRLVYFSQVELVINQYVWAVIFGGKDCYNLLRCGSHYIYIYREREREIERERERN